MRTNQGFNPATGQPGAGDNSRLPGTDAEAKETFWVSKPAAAKKIGENLLRENFGFEEIDIQSYKKLYGEFTIFDEKQCAINEKADKPCKAATTEQIQKWQTSADGKKVSVTLPESMVKLLHDFRQERLIERRVMDVADPELRAKLENNLKAAVTQTGQARAAAFTDLRNMLEDHSPDGKKAAAVIKLVANLPENKENPFTQVLLAKIELKELHSGETVMFNPNDVIAIEQRINHAADLPFLTHIY